MSGEKKAKGWRFYGLVGFGAIALLSAGVWALQYAGSGPEKTLSPLVVHNNLQIDLNEPDLFLDSDSLSQLPKDLLTIPFLHDVLSEDFVFYYQNHADRLGIEGSIRRIVYEHDLTLKDKLFSSLLDQPGLFDIQHFAMGNNTTQPANQRQQPVPHSGCQVMGSHCQAAPGSIWASFMT